MITLLDQSTINKIAAGEVVERPAAVVKELVENAIDAKANAITIEIKEGGVSFIRITDNGCGIEEKELSLAFKRHSTSKIKSVEDLMTVKSLGFRGEALASIAAVSQVELVTKTRDALTGARFLIEGGEEKGLEQIGCPDGTTFLIRNLFYNTPARRKFLKSAMTEASYVSDLVERLAISNPGISFKFINNNQVKLHTAGNFHLKDIIYHVYGRDITKETLEINHQGERLKITGYIGKPVISRGNRNYMNYFINGRYIKSSVINKAIEESYKPYTMTHRYPFTVLSLEMDSSLIDVNVHPAKMEVRFSNQEEVFRTIKDVLLDALAEKELIPSVNLDTPKEQRKKEKEERHAKLSGSEPIPEPFETSRLEKEPPFVSAALKSSVYTGKAIPQLSEEGLKASEEQLFVPPASADTVAETPVYEGKQTPSSESSAPKPPKQMELFEERFLSKRAQEEYRILGQIFSTYWIVELKDKIFLVDQHAAHEKVLYEKTLENLENGETLSQMINPPVILTLSMHEEETVRRYQDTFARLGFELEAFGGKEYAVRAVPANLTDLAQKDLLIELIDGLGEEGGSTSPELLLNHVASMSCKAAVKGNRRLSEAEAKALLKQLMSLENPYHCPHGRPTIVSMTKYEIEKKFKRIV